MPQGHGSIRPAHVGNESVISFALFFFSFASFVQRSSPSKKNILRLRLQNAEDRLWSVRVRSASPKLNHDHIRQSENYACFRLIVWVECDQQWIRFLNITLFGLKREMSAQFVRCFFIFMCCGMLKNEIKPSRNLKTRITFAESESECCSVLKVVQLWLFGAVFSDFTAPPLTNTICNLDNCDWCRKRKMFDSSAETCTCGALGAAF